MTAPVLVAALASLAFAAGALAQTVGPPAKHNNNTYGSPLDTLKSSRLWTDTPEPKDFVRDSRLPAGALDYTPLTGTDPVRPKPRDAANVAALQAEMEHAGAKLVGRAKRPPSSVRRAATGGSMTAPRAGTTARAAAAE